MYIFFIRIMGNSKEWCNLWRKLDPRGLCYQCFQHGPDFLFGKLSIKDFNDEPHFPEIIKVISSWIQINTLLKANDERKISKCDKSIHKAMRIRFDIHQTNKNFSVTVKPINACKLEFADHLWLTFLDQLHSDILVFAIIKFQIYNITVTKWKYGIYPNSIITFN